MFDNDDGSEAWAFFPKELAPLLKLRMDNANSVTHTYGIDDSVVSYIYDANRDGYINSSQGDKVWIFFGLRRGGRILYALDVTNPDSPVFKWGVGYTMTGYTELGQTWSTPQVASVPGHVDGSGKPKPVLIFGGGYDPSKDGAGLATSDTMGRAIYVVDADTGTRLWSVAASGTDSSTHVVDATLLHGIAAPVSTLDSDGDGFRDRVYAADTGGNIWRMDMPSTNKATWKIRKFAELNGGDAANDRRFFSKPDIARTYKDNKAYDAVLIGSGDRTNPLATDVTNRLYALHDLQTGPYHDADPNCNATPSEFRCIMPLSEADGELYDATANTVQDGGTASVRETAAQNIYDKYGWYISLEQTGEKSLSSSITLNGVSYFTSYYPNPDNSNACVPGAGTARVYALDTQNASSVFDFTGNDTLTKEDRYVQLGSLILDRPSIHVDDDGKIRIFFPAGGTGGTTNDQVDPTSSSFDTESDIKPPTGIFWYLEEN
jgi:type IV pilus assembly protein PilY1